MRFLNNFIDSNKVNRSPIFWWLLAAILLCFTYVFFVVSDFSNETKEANIKKRIEKVLVQKENHLNQIFRSLELNAVNDDYSLSQFKDQLLDDNIEVFLFKQDTLKSWSSNLIAIENYKEDFRTLKVLKLNNGWYRVFHKHINSLDLYGAILLKQSYNYSNEFLKASFPDEFKIADNYQINLDSSRINVMGGGDELLFSLNPPESSQLTEAQVYKLFFAFHFLLLLIIIFILKFYERFAYILKYSKLIYLIVSIDLLFLWAIIKFIRIPSILFDSFLYSPILFADDFNRSLGDFFTNTFFCWCIF